MKHCYVTPSFPQQMTTDLLTPVLKKRCINS